MKNTNCKKLENIDDPWENIFENSEEFLSDFFV